MANRVVGMFRFRAPAPVSARGLGWPSLQFQCHPERVCLYFGIYLYLLCIPRCLLNWVCMCVCVRAPYVPLKVNWFDRTNPPLPILAFNIHPEGRSSPHCVKFEFLSVTLNFASRGNAYCMQHHTTHMLRHCRSICRTHY